jgi:hypothetical protein
VCRGSGSGGRVAGGGRGSTLVVTSTTMGDVGGAECGLGGEVRRGGNFIGTVGTEDGASGRGVADSDESTFEWVDSSSSSRSIDPGRPDSCFVGQQKCC